jgi:UDP-galactopyranose mutase
MSNHAEPIVVFSHLRWDFVYQRPQHLLSRLARERRVLFIEEPIHQAASTPRIERREGAPNVLVCQPHTPEAAPGFHDAHLPLYRQQVPKLLAEQGVGRPILWMYTPMALPFADGILPLVTVYDCMDELSLFKGAPPALLAREAELLARADLVFTGGPSLYRAKRDRHPAVYCFPSSVDAQHFRQGRAGEAEAADQAKLSRPRLGFYGVIDERLDLALLEALAAAHPEWQLVIVGPVVKIDPATLPRRDNIFYAGQRSYAELPAYLAGWDVCLLPFARNDATRFISPTKTLEYMAAEHMIVSTPIADVAEPYGDIVFLGDTPEEFIAACEQALSLEPEEREQRLARMRAVLERTSWDRTVSEMAELIRQAVRAGAAA